MFNISLNKDLTTDELKTFYIRNAGARKLVKKTMKDKNDPVYGGNSFWSIGDKTINFDNHVGFWNRLGTRVTHFFKCWNPTYRKSFSQSLKKIARVFNNYNADAKKQVEEAKLKKIEAFDADINNINLDIEKIKNEIIGYETELKSKSNELSPLEALKSSLKELNAQKQAYAESNLINKGKNLIGISKEKEEIEKLEKQFQADLATAQIKVEQLDPKINRLKENLEVLRANIDGKKEILEGRLAILKKFQEEKAKLTGEQPKESKESSSDDKSSSSSHSNLNPPIPSSPATPSVVVPKVNTENVLADLERISSRSYRQLFEGLFNQINTAHKTDMIASHTLNLKENKLTITLKKPVRAWVKAISDETPGGVIFILGKERTMTFIYKDKDSELKMDDGFNIFSNVPEKYAKFGKFTESQLASIKIDDTKGEITSTATKFMIRKERTKLLSAAIKEWGEATVLSDDTDNTEMLSKEMLKNKS